MSKRHRDDLSEDEAAMAAMELGSTLGRGLDVKLRVSILLLFYLGYHYSI